ncbi:nicotinate-nucleotide adenylyltransferase [Clostridium saccharobutylicum]|uniref:Probable nicotinate-nucleotide adenylyltransferase n=1 Tax=Clostridium saccharobutylicum DSM 13864 TaxID=1345695 RepID=U5MMA3_CLOSA|nr:nicotinate-nucleotide adenylyltransferase [Clostridium saccharobutylicum]AGX41658.1 nicotinate-nucleotide adenylyltransferase NadD [Clostridium saccharobutylicum DSM 13864]AQR88941.1 nicotinate-nucleotide adenylyltransferase [Clostridium saccharobutylicum]AQR98842.1 nicotinate-nucleotide adenylyltransferase [Clostridium saccharobutylicum]AQS08560.1 nicotinate-nucleotide adenylyltransferase [Clostridium saccharobutylicum]AQS12830.1 nicotinate-nucleotide adenylyltransferase [Clostridium sacch
MKRYGIIGGTFDPIHYAHLYIAYEAKVQLNLDEVVFMPAGKQPLKTESTVTDSALRYDMVKIAIEPFEEFSISSYEIEKKGLSFTYETLEYLKENDESKQLFFITGADCLMDIEKWKEISKIFSLCTLVVFFRGGFNKEELRAQKKRIENKYNANIIILELKELEISSTYIRSRIRDGKRVDFFIPPKVNNFIVNHKLYLRTIKK